jgi:uncharacterized protein (TIGR03435 family)
LETSVKLKGVALFLCCFAGVGIAQQQNPSTTSATWEKAAGSSIAFEVASVRADKEPFKSPSFALSADEWFREPNGRFHADFALPTYIQFAYKVWLTPEEQRAMLEHLPAWVKEDRFAIEAVAPLHATKDQYRLMMRALLVERFGLSLHFEQQEHPVFAMVLVKPGKPGPRLIPHEKGQACDEKPKPGTFPYECYGFAATAAKDGMFLSGSRASSMDQIANFVGSEAGNSGEVGRRVVNRTGLTGLWDFTVEAPPPGRLKSQDQTTVEPTMLEMMRDQLGIKLKADRAVVSVPVIDHIERPSEN